MIHPDLFAVIVCPETHQSLAMAGEELLAKINVQVEAGTCENVGGEKVDRPLDEGLVRDDGSIVYPVRDDIPVLLVEEGIRTTGL